MKRKFDECSFCDVLLDDSQICPSCHVNYNGIEQREEEEGDW